MRKMFFTNKRWVIVLAILSVLVISGCSIGPNRGTSYQKRYYQGYDSLDMKFLDGSPPNTFYYDSESFNNEIPIAVEVRNKGASQAYGAIFIHGYDPNIIEVAGGGLPGPGNINWNSGSGTLNIGGIYIGLSGGGSFGSGTIGWISPNNHYYGGTVFTQNGNFVGLNVNINLNSNNIGARLANPAFSALQSLYGWNAPIVLEGDTPESPGGGMEVYEFPSYIYYLPESLEKFRQPIMVTACYTYVTRASTMICIDPKPNSNSNKACIARDVSLSGGQGGPVAVTRVEQQSSSDKVVLTITVKHNKKNVLDELFDVTQLFYKCNPHSGSTIKPSDKNVVDILYVELSGLDITATCSGGGKIRLDQSGNGQFTCTGYINQLSDSAYEAPLLIELGYGYGKNIYKEVTIKKI